MTFLDFIEKFPTEESIIDYFIKIRYGDKVVCPHCGNEVVYRRNNWKNFDCKACNNTFSVFSNTIFEKSDTDLRKWFFAIHLFLNSKKGISGYQLQREIGVTYKTAWRMLKQIRMAMGNKENENLFEAVIEVDETYVGGKPRKDNEHKDDNNKRGRGTKKTPVFGLKERNSKKVHVEVLLPNSENKKLTGKQLLTIIDRICKDDSILISDEFRSYRILDKKNYYHFVIDHKKAYADGDIHTNGIESFWALLKRGIYGIYHHVSVKYLQNYINEFIFRLNNNNGNMFDKVLKQGIF